MDERFVPRRLGGKTVKSMKLSINPRWQGKMPQNMSPDTSREWWRQFNGGFLNVDITNSDFVKAVRLGFAYTSQHRQYRKRENFVQSQFVAIDFDTNDERSSFDYLLRDELISQHASFLHTTPSHTSNTPRCRVVFELDKPITSVTKYELLVRSFLHHFGYSDPSCKDANRLYFGAKDCQIEYVNQVFSLYEAARLVEPYQLCIEQRRIEMAERIANGTSDVSNEVVQYEVAMLLERVRTAQKGEKHLTILKIGKLLGGMCAAGYFDTASAIKWLQNAIALNDNDVKDVQLAFQTIQKSVLHGMSEPYYL